jgi:hypothetical protein
MALMELAHPARPLPPFQATMSVHGTASVVWAGRKLTAA